MVKIVYEKPKYGFALINSPSDYETVAERRQRTSKKLRDELQKKTLKEGATYTPQKSFSQIKKEATNRANQQTLREAYEKINKLQSEKEQLENVYKSVYNQTYNDNGLVFAPMHRSPNQTSAYFTVAEGYGV